MTKRAIVVGGGIGGLAASIALSRAGWDVDVFERQPGFAEIGASLTLWPNALAALDALGVGADARAAALGGVDGGFMTDRGKWLTRLNTEELQRRYGEVAVLTRPDLLNLLLRAVPRGSLHPGVTVDWVCADGTVVAGGAQHRADLVVGADGVRSTVRRLVWPDAPAPKYSKYTAWRFNTEPLDEPLTVGSWLWGPGRSFGYTPLTGRRAYCYIIEKAPAGGRDKDLSAYTDWPDPIPTLVRSVAEDDVLRHDIYEGPRLGSYVSGRVVLIGDAAHAMVPSLGQGACTSLEDAVTLGVYAEDPVRYDRARRRRTQRIVVESRMIMDTAHVSAPGLPLLRNVAYAMVPHSLNLRLLQPDWTWQPPKPVPTRGRRVRGNPTVSESRPRGRFRFGLADAGVHSRVAPDLVMRLTRMQAAVTRADSMWVPDHLIGVTPRALVTPEHIGVSRLVPSLDASYEPWTALGFLSAGNRLARVRWGVGVTDISRRHPVATAHAAATLHQLSRGRAILGIGTGERENSAPYGVPLRRSVDRYEEALATIRALWNSHGQPISRDSPYFPLRDAVFAVPPYRGTRPEIWAGAHGPRMLGVAGRYADGWLPGITMSPGEYADQLRTLRDAADDFGRDPDGIVAAKWFFVATAYSKDAVDELLEAPAVKSYALCAPAEYWARHGVEHPLGPDFAGAHDILPQTLDEETALAYAKRVPTSLIRDFALAGTPAEILEQIDDWRAHGLGYPVLTNMGPLHPKIGRGVLTSLPFTQVLFGLHGFGGKRS